MFGARANRCYLRHLVGKAYKCEKINGNWVLSIKTDDNTTFILVLRNAERLKDMKIGKKYIVLYNTYDYDTKLGNELVEFHELAG